MMRLAVKNGKVKESSPALLGDSIALAHGKKQIDGSQIAQGPITHLLMHPYRNGRAG